MKRNILIASVLILFCFAPYASAQSRERAVPIFPAAAPVATLPALDAPLFGGVGSEKPKGNVDCFDYYHFGSVVTNISPSLARTIPGATIAFSGDIRNENTYPVVGLDLYVKIFRRQAQDTDTLMNGEHLVAQFVAVGGMNLDAASAKPFSFEWSVPAGTIPGEYVIATYAMTGKKYNLSGLSFTDDVTGATASFTVGGASLGGVFWDKNKVALNKSPLAFAAPVSVFSADEPVAISAPLVNSLKTERTVKVSWKQYNWDGLREDALVSSKVETITLDAGETRVLSYTATSYEGPVTYVVADVETLGAHTILDVRFARSGVRQARINFPSITEFPLMKGQPATLFSCVHAVGKGTLSDGDLTLTLADANGKTIASEVYRGGITGAMMGIAKTFTPTKNYNKVTLTATLSRQGLVEDVGSVVYDCTAIDATKCAREEKSPLLTILLVIMLIACAIIWGMYFKKRSMRTPIAVIALAVMCGTIWGAHPIPVMANTTSWTSPAFTAHVYDGIPVCIQGGVWCDADGYVELGPIAPVGPYGSPDYITNGEPPTRWKFSLGQLFQIDASVATVNYSADAKIGVATLSDGAVVNVGDTIVFTPNFTATDISWNATGSYTDSPFGTWSGSPRSYATLTIEPTGNFGDVALQSALEIIRPTPTIAQSGTAGLSCVLLTCTVTSAGTIITTMTYGATTGTIFGAINKQFLGSGQNVWFPAGSTLATLPAQDGALMLSNCGVNGWGGLATPAQNSACYNMASTNKFVLNVPARTITFNFTAVIPDNAPNAPTITGPVTGLVDTSYTFTFTATDPDGDNLHYEIDWDNDGTVDACAPGSCANVTSGTARSASYTWSPPAASHTFRARTTAGGLTSGWTSHTISISLPAGPPAPTLTGPGSVGSGSTWSVVLTAGGTSVDCDMTRTSAPTWSDQSYPSVGTTETITAALGAFIGPGTLTYRARCVDAYGQWSSWSSTVVTVLSPVPALSIVPLAGGTIIPNIPVGNSGTFSFTVRNIGETGSVISGTASAFVNPPFSCSFGCTYDSPAGGALGLDAGAPAQTVTISFTPTTPGSVVSMIIFPGNAGAAPIVTGIGISPLVFAPTPIDFGQVVITKSKTIKLRISNISVVNIPAFALVLPAGPFTCESGCTSASIVAGGYRDAVIRFTPAVSGSVTRIMTLSGRTETIDISGNGVPPEWSVIEE